MVSRLGRMGWLVLWAGLLMLSLSSPGSAAARPKGKQAGDESKQIAGWVERIRILPGKRRSPSRSSTRAPRPRRSMPRTSSVSSEGGRAWVRYTLVLKESKTTTHRVPRESPLVRKVYIKDHDQQSDAAARRRIGVLHGWASTQRAILPGRSRRLSLLRPARARVPRRILRGGSRGDLLDRRSLRTRETEAP